MEDDTASDNNNSYNGPLSGPHASELNIRPPPAGSSASGFNNRLKSVASVVSYDRPPSVPPPPLDEIPVYSPDDEPPAYEPPQKPECPSLSAPAVSLDVAENELPPMSSSININYRTEQEKKRAKSSLKSNLIINVTLIFLGPIFLCALPCCLGVMIVYCIALKEYHMGDYAGSDNILNKGTYCFIFWVFTSVIGGVAFLVSIAYIV